MHLKNRERESHYYYFVVHLLGFILVGKFFRRAERMVRLDERKGNKVLISISTQLYIVFAFFGDLFFTESCSFGRGLSAMTSQVKERTESVGWLRMVPFLNGLDQILFICNNCIM